MFVSSTLGELAAERAAVREAIERLRLTPVMFELGARPHPPRELYRAYLEQSHVFLGLYWERYGWVAQGEVISGLEDEYRLAGDRPRLLYLKQPAPEREPRLDALVATFQADDRASYKGFSSIEELVSLVEEDLALLLSERFEAASRRDRGPEVTDFPRSSGVPLPLTDTIGREIDIEAVAAELREGRRLITLTGPGGVGKSRLAAEVARLIETDVDAVHFVPLAAVADADTALLTIVDRLGIRLESVPPVDVLASHVRGRAVVVVLDNVEQVGGMGVAIVELLGAAPDLQILTTSRQALRVRGEWEYAVATLAVPEAGDGLAQVAARPAVQLFVDRASAVSRQLDLTEANAPAIAEIVRRLDGLPLAVELAAAQVRVLTPGAVLERLVSALDMPVPSAVDLPARQRTLRATLDWSHALLTESEQALFARLSVFEGGWTIEAVEAVCAASEGPDVLETLATLLDKSLVISDHDESEAAPRFRMLETVRTYAVERLEARRETAEMRRRHLAWCRGLAARAQPGLCGPGQQDWVARMAPERANLRRAVDTALGLGDHVAVVALAWDVVVLYFVRDAVDEPDAWLRQVVDAEPALDEVTDAKLRSLFALTRIHHGDYEGVPAALVGPLEVFRARSMDFETAVVLHQIGFVAYHLDHDVDAAIAALEESSALFAGLDHEWGVGLAEAMLGSVFAAEGDLANAEAHQERSLEQARKIDSDQQIVQALGQIVLIRLLEERYDTALEVLTEAVPILDRGHFRADSANALDALAVIAHDRGDDRAAAIAVSVAAAERGRLGVEPWPTVQTSIDRIHQWVHQSLGDEAFAAVAREASDLDLFDTLHDTLRVASRAMSS